MKTIVLFLLITAPLYSQSSGIENLDSKYGFNKFRLEEPVNKYSGEIKYNGKRDLDNVDLYIYNGPSIGKVFGYFNAKAIYLVYVFKLKWTFP